MRHLALALLASLLFACQSAAPAPDERGTWRLAANASLRDADGGSAFGDATSFDGSLSAGQFLSDRLLVEALLRVAIAEAEANGVESELSEVVVGGGARYYFQNSGAARPYIGAAVGIDALDIDVGGTSDSDAAPVAQGRAGVELFLTDTVAVDLAFLVQQAFDVEVFGVEDDLTSTAVVAGLSVRL